MNESRIESYTVGGQILAPESTVRVCGPILPLDDASEIMPKGVRELFDQQGRVVTGEVYVKVTKVRQSSPLHFLAACIAVPPEADDFLEKLLNPQGKRQ